MKTTKEIEEQEDRSFEEDDSPDIPPPDIVAYNESRSCADLYRMYTQGLLEIQPEFQREIVWKGPAQTRFVDSLIKQFRLPRVRCRWRMGDEPGVVSMLELCPADFRHGGDSL